MTTTPTLAAALEYAARGWPVFFLGRTKRPVANCIPCKDAGHQHDPAACTCLTCHGFYAASTDPDRVERMHDRVRCGLLAIRTGAVSGLAVVDVDPRNGGTVDTVLMPPTYCVRTGGGGWHLYYRYPGEPLANEIPGRPGVDVKADGGYVVAPPSQHPDTNEVYRRVGDREVREMPPRLLAACRPVAPVHTPSTERRPDAGGITNPSALLASNLDAVARAPEGKRRHTLYGAARGVARMVLAGAISEADAWSELTRVGRLAGQSERDIRAAIHDGFTAEGATRTEVAA